jgi:CheY-like chemotaxis protein/DNA-binding XRE family transcriptional regulator
MQSSEARSRFATSLRRWRNRRGFSQEELAERANLHRTYISDVERGARNLSLESINKLATALEVSVPILFSSPEPTATDATVQNGKPMDRSTFVDILLVEDNPDDVALTLQAFKKARFLNSVHVARDGVEALDYFFGPTGIAPELEKGRNLVVLLDLQLPKVNGLEVLRRLKADARTSNIAVVLLTASESEQDIALCQKLGATAYITKPVNLQRLSKITPELCLVWALIKPADQPRAG